MALTVPAIPGVPRSLPNDAQTFLSAVKYTLDVREGRVGSGEKFVTGTEVQGFIRDIYSGAKGKTFIKKVANFLGDSGGGIDSDIHLSDITGDGLVTITADGQIVISAEGGLVIQDEGTLIINTGSYLDPSGAGLLVGDVVTTTGWVLNEAGQFSWYGGLPLHCLVLADGSGTGIAWQQATGLGLEPIDVAFKVYAGDCVWGGYNYKVTSSGIQLGGLFWDQTAGTLHMRGNIKNAIVTTGGILTISNTGYIYIESNTNTSGLLVGSLDSVTGWKINAKGMFGFNGTGGVHAFSLANSVSWQGSTIDANDAVIGSYFISKGLWWDNSEGKLYVKGEIVDGSITTGDKLEIDATGYIFINTSTANSGLIVGSYTTGSGWLLHGAGIFGASGSAQLHAFTIANGCTWQSNTMDAGDAVIGQYWSSGGLFWDQSGTTLYIKGNIVVGTVTGSGYIHINTSTANSGLLIGNFSGGTGWLVHSKGLFGYSGSSGYFAMSLSSVSWDSMTIDTGDVMIGKYNTGKGIFWDNSAGLLYVRGSLNVTGAQSITMDTTGGFTMEAGAFSITGGTVSISTTSGLTIASGSKITINSTDGVVFSSAGKIHYSGTNLYLLSANDLWLSSTSGYVRSLRTFLPYSGNTLGCGSSTYYWISGHFGTVYQKTEGSGDKHVTSFDHLDDLEVVSRYGGSEMIEPFHVLPVECTNIAKLAEEEGITVEDVYDRKDLEAKVFYNPLMVGIFSLGAIKQLYNRVQELERRLN